MSHVQIDGLTKHFDGKPPTKAVDDLQLGIEEGEFLVLLGPSGCGKTTTLRCLAGLETPSAGRIAFGDMTVFDAGRRVNLTPDKRNIGMVFQSYALWPHMTVRRNIAYPLRARKIKEGLRWGWVDTIAELVDCGNLLDRYPAQLSGGQQQRVALARGLVARPDLVLFDEPLSNLDARLRDQVRAELHALHQRLGFTAVFVTHDQSEALALGDRLAIMKGGKIEQLGTAEEVFERPASEYVAAFVGMGNRLPCEYADGRWIVAGAVLEGSPIADGGTTGAVTARLRADDVRLAPTDSALADGECRLPAVVVDCEYGGKHLDLSLDVNETRVRARIPAGDRGSWARGLKADDPVALSFHPGDVRLFADGDAGATDPVLEALASEVAAPESVAV